MNILNEAPVVFIFASFDSEVSDFTISWISNDSWHIEHLFDFIHLLGEEGALDGLRLLYLIAHLVLNPVFE